MKTEHTPEPWKSIEEQFHGEVMNFIGDKDGGTIGEIYTEDDASRIVACVNACAGLPTEVLERYKLGVIGVDYKSTKQQRDELLAALEQFVTWGRRQHKSQSKGCHATFDMMALKDEIDLAEAAITSVKGDSA